MDGDACEFEGMDGCLLSVGAQCCPLTSCFEFTSHVWSSISCLGCSLQLGPCFLLVLFLSRALSMSWVSRCLAYLKYHKERYERIDLLSGDSLLLEHRRGWKVAMLCDVTEDVGIRWRGALTEGVYNFHSHCSLPELLTKLPGQETCGQSPI